MCLIVIVNAVGFNASINAQFLLETREIVQACLDTLFYKNYKLVSLMKLSIVAVLWMTPFDRPLDKGTAQAIWPIPITIILLGSRALNYQHCPEKMACVNKARSDVCCRGAETSEEISLLKMK